MLRAHSRWAEKMMFLGSDHGGRTAAVLASLIVTCKSLGIDAFAYLHDLFARISSQPQSRLAEILPDQWQVSGQSALNSSIM
jgi:transposase